MLRGNLRVGIFIEIGLILLDLQLLRTRLLLLFLLHHTFQMQVIQTLPAQPTSGRVSLLLPSPLILLIDRLAPFAGASLARMLH